jgi:hypothetical protein
VLLGVLALPVAADDVVGPAAVTELRVAGAGDDLVLTWDVVTADAAGQPETVDYYRIYRDVDPDFVPDREGGSNEIGTSTTPEYVETGAAADGVERYFYRVSAVDEAGNESITKPSLVRTPPMLSGQWTDTGIDLEWTDAQPSSEVVGYLVYYGTAAGAYEFVDDVGLATSHTLTGLDDNVNWYSSVRAVDTHGNESAFSNEHVDAVGGTIVVRAHDESELCWGAGGCPPQEGEVQRADGFQINAPVDFPEGDWVSVTVELTMDSRLCTDPIAPDKCGDGNPGWNPCGDPWDRTAHLYLVLDDCIDAGGSCITHDNLELIRAITPFGTDAPPPDGTGVVPPRTVSFDVTPYLPLLTGRRYVGAHIGHYTPAGWWVTSEFRFSERPEDASPEPPADGIEVLFFGGVQPPTDTVSVPADATEVKTRLFTTGHGGNPRCDGGDRDGDECTGNGDCPGGTCQNCDEFCHRTNRILVDGESVWQHVPWRDCCYPRGTEPFCFDCQQWNACGYPSCTFDRAGWCPGEIACHENDPCDQDLPMTEHFPPGGTYDVDYDVLVRTGSWSVSLVLYWYR